MTLGKGGVWAMALLLAASGTGAQNPAPPQIPWSEWVSGADQAFRQGDLAKAEELYETALNRAEWAGRNDQRTVFTLTRLAEVFEKERKFSDAETTYRQALAIWERALGPNNLILARSLRKLARVYREEAKDSDAERAFKRALAIQESGSRADDPRVAQDLKSLAEIYLAHGRYAEAEEFSRRALSIWEAALGNEHPLVASAMNDLALAEEAQGNYSDAEAGFRGALEIVRKTMGPDDPALARTFENYASLLRKTDRVPEAEKMEAAAKAIRTQHKSSSTPIEEGAPN